MSRSEKNFISTVLAHFNIRMFSFPGLYFTPISDKFNYSQPSCKFIFGIFIFELISQSRWENRTFGVENNHYNMKFKEEPIYEVAMGKFKDNITLCSLEKYVITQYPKLVFMAKNKLVFAFGNFILDENKCFFENYLKHNIYIAGKALFSAVETNFFTKSFYPFLFASKERGWHPVGFCNLSEKVIWCF